MRGKLLFKFLAELAQLDTSKTALTAPGYDPDFQEPLVLYQPDGSRVEGRKETCIRLPCQVETTKTDDERMTPAGNAPATMLRLVFHFRDLENMGLVDKNGHAKIRVNDRLEAIYTRTGQLLHRYINPPGAFLTQVEPVGFGPGGKRNLLVCWAHDRAQAKLG